MSKLRSCIYSLLLTANKETDKKKSKSFKEDNVMTLKNKKLPPLIRSERTITLFFVLSKRYDIVFFIRC